MKSKISPEEKERRREDVRQAIANNRIEGLVHDSRADRIVQAYINGELEVSEAIEELNRLFKKGRDKSNHR